MPASRGWWRLRVSTMTLKQRDWWLEHRDALKRNGPKLYFMYWMGIRISVWWVRCCVVCASYIRLCLCSPLLLLLLLDSLLRFFFRSCVFYIRIHIHSGILSVVCMFHLSSAILFVSLVRFLVSLIASRYFPCLCKTHNTHIFGAKHTCIHTISRNKQTKWNIHTKDITRKKNSAAARHRHIGIGNDNNS